MSNKFFSTFIRPIFVWVFLIVVVAFCLWFISHKYIEWQNLASQPGSLDRLKAENGNLTTIAQICGGLFLLVGLCFTGWNAWIARMNMVIAQRNMVIAQRNMKRNMKIAEDGKITDRFSKAIEQLGSDKLEIRLGGIYALERIAIDSEKDHPQVMEVFTAFVRNNSFRKKNEIDEPTSRTWAFLRILPTLTSKEKLDTNIDTDIQAILTVIGRRTSAYIEREKWPLDLNRTYLSKALLQGAHLQKTNLYEADLQGAHLQEAHLQEARLAGAKLQEAHLKRAHLQGAHLQEANLQKANLYGAYLQGAHLQKADLQGAYLAGAKLQEAKLAGAMKLTIDQLSTVKTLYNVVGLNSTLLKQVQENYPHLLVKP